MASFNRNLLVLFVRKIWQWANPLRPKQEIIFYLAEIPFKSTSCLHVYLLKYILGGFPVGLNERTSLNC